MTLTRCLVTLLILCSYSCNSRYKVDDYSRIEDVRSSLTYGLSSYASIDEAKKKLYLQKDDFVVVEDSVASTQPKVPPFNIFTIRMDSAQIAEHDGALVLSFFNNRLMEMRYFPYDIEVFAEDINLNPEDLRMPGGVKIEPYTKAWISKDYENKYYIGWIDIRLKDQYDAWIKDYS